MSVRSGVRSTGTGVKNLVSTRFFTLSDHAARKSGPEEKYAFQSLTYKGFEIGVFSDGISGALGRPAAQSSGVKKRCRAFFHSLHSNREGMLSGLSCLRSTSLLRNSCPTVLTSVFSYFFERLDTVSVNFSPAFLVCRRYPELISSLNRMFLFSYY